MRAKEALDDFHKATEAETFAGCVLRDQELGDHGAKDLGLTTPEENLSKDVARTGLFKAMLGAGGFKFFSSLYLLSVQGNLFQVNANVVQELHKVSEKF